MQLKTTPLSEEHKSLGAKMAPFGGWLMPIQYSGIIQEHNHTRNSCGVFDICHMSEIYIYGLPEQTGLGRILTQPVSKMNYGECRYGFMLNEEGGIIDDTVIYKLKDDLWMLVANAATLKKDLTHLKKHVKTKSCVEDVSSKIAKIDVQGPASQEVLKSLIKEDIRGMQYYYSDIVTVLNSKNIVSRTGYTGELGYEIYLKTDTVKDIWHKLLEDSRVKPAGLGARDTLRLEMGYPLYGQDIDEGTTPLEAGLAKFVDFDKEFIGKDALLKKKEPSRRMTFFISENRRSPRHNYPVFSEGHPAGTVTSGSFSPSLSVGIGMGYVKNEYAKTGERLAVRGGNSEIAVTICEKPFYKKATAKRRT
jgi:aminomethyltransferase